jgi:hypothetical protein
MWSPKANKPPEGRTAGARNPFYDYMTEVQPGDVVFSYFKKAIRAIGLATSRAESSSKPDFGRAGSSWSDDGWLVKVEFSELAKSIVPKEHLNVLRKVMPEKHQSITQSGTGKELYLRKL